MENFVIYVNDNFHVQIAHSKRHGVDVAIKIVTKEKYTSSGLIKYLLREIVVVKGLRHENLIRYYEAIETSHRYRDYIILTIFSAPVRAGPNSRFLNCT